MSKLIIFVSIIYFSVAISYGATWKKLSSGSTNDPCPTNYVLVPALAPYTTRDFCVMKYEAKNDGYGTVVSVAAGLPWTSINRDNARAACKSLGINYDLVSNDQWQSMVRDIASVASNWSTGIVGSGQLNPGHTDNAPASILAAVTDDNDPCNGTAQTCTSTTWNSQRRTNTLSNGNVIWDLGGNAGEWVTNHADASPGATTYISNFSTGDIRQTRYGAASGTICATPAVSPYCGMGYGNMGAVAGNANTRGGAFYFAASAGIFAAYINVAPTFVDARYGFRCIFAP